MARSSHCGCCGNTIVAAVPTPRCLDGPASLRPLTSQSTKLARIHVRRKSVKNTRMCPLRSCSGGKWSSSRSSESRRRTDAVPMALYTNLAKVEQARKQSAPSMTDSQVSESNNDLTEQELRLGVAGKIISPSKLLRVGVDVDEGVDLLLMKLQYCAFKYWFSFCFSYKLGSLDLLDFWKAEFRLVKILVHHHLRIVLAVLGSFLASLNTFIAEEYLLHHNVSEYYVYDFMKVSICHILSSDLRC